MVTQDRNRAGATMMNRGFAALQFVLQLHAMWGREMAGGPLAPAAAALQMGAKERAVYLGHRLSRNIKAWLPVIKA